MADLPAIMAAGANGWQLEKRERGALAKLKTTEIIHSSWMQTELSLYMTVVCHPVAHHATSASLKKKKRKKIFVFDF